MAIAIDTEADTVVAGRRYTRASSPAGTTMQRIRPNVHASASTQNRPVGARSYATLRFTTTMATTKIIRAPANRTILAVQALRVRFTGWIRAMLRLRHWTECAHTCAVGVLEHDASRAPVWIACVKDRARLLRQQLLSGKTTGQESHKRGFQRCSARNGRSKCARQIVEAVTVQGTDTPLEIRRSEPDSTLVRIASARRAILSFACQPTGYSGNHKSPTAQIRKIRIRPRR